MFLTVQLLVKSRDEALKSQVFSLLSRELRSLGDISIVDEKPYFVITALVDRVQNVGTPVGLFAMATHISRPLDASTLTDCSRFPMTCLPGLDTVRLAGLKIFLDRSAVTYDLDLATGPLSQVQQNCKAIIADFDTKIAGQFRELWKQMVEASKKVGQ